MSYRALIMLALLAAAVPDSVLAAQAPAMLVGAVKATLVLDETLLNAEPSTSVDISFKTAKGIETGSYAGVLLWDLVNKAGLVNDPGKNTELRHTILVTGDDGYVVALSLGEIEPDYQGNKVVLAYRSGTTTSYSDLRLVIPGDAHGGRAVRGVVKIEVK